MFRDIRSALQRKERLLSKKEQKIREIADAVREFTVREFPKPLPINLFQDDETLILETASKTYANELVMRLPILIEILKKRGIKMSRVVVR